MYTYTWLDCYCLRKGLLSPFELLLYKSLSSPSDSSPPKYDLSVMEEDRLEWLSLLKKYKRRILDLSSKLELWEQAAKVEKGRLKYYEAQNIFPPAVLKIHLIRQKLKMLSHKVEYVKKKLAQINNAIKDRDKLEEMRAAHKDSPPGQALLTQ